MQANFYSDLVLGFAHLSAGPMAGRCLRVSGLGILIVLWNSEVSSEKPWSQSTDLGDSGVLVECLLHAWAIVIFFFFMEV